jgi:hypothetical protein
MATTTSNSGTEATRRNTTASTTDEGLGGTARQVAENVAGAAGEVTARIPEVPYTFYNYLQQTIYHDSKSEEHLYSKTHKTEELLKT